jgi:hypothetical protein
MLINATILMLFTMKRDWDVIREILQKTEELQPNYMLKLEDFDPAKAFNVSYNVKLLKEAGLLKVEFSEVLTRDAEDFLISNLTWEGHEFFESMKSESVWKKTKDKIIEKGGAMTFDVVKEVAKTIALDFMKSL